MELGDRRKVKKKDSINNIIKHNIREAFQKCGVGRKG
jgi:hypothetical protein